MDIFPKKIIHGAKYLNLQHLTLCWEKLMLNSLTNWSTFSTCQHREANCLNSTPAICQQLIQMLLIYLTNFGTNVTGEQTC